MVSSSPTSKVTSVAVGVGVIVLVGVGVRLGVSEFGALVATVAVALGPAVFADGVVVAVTARDRSVDGATTGSPAKAALQPLRRSRLIKRIRTCKRIKRFYL